MNEQERRVNHTLRALDEAYRLGRLPRSEYRARRRELLTSLSDSNGVTARNAIVPPPPRSTPREGGAHRMAAPTVNEFSTLFPERRVSLRKHGLLVGGMVLLAIALVLWMLRHMAG